MCIESSKFEEAANQFRVVNHFKNVKFKVFLTFAAFTKDCRTICTLQKGGNTKSDIVMKRIWKRVQNEEIISVLRQFLAAQDVDTDCIEDDIKIFHEQNESNLHDVLKGNMEAFDAVQKFLRHHRILSRSFATGYPLFYWKWYRTATEKEVSDSILAGSMMDLGGHTVKELSVDPHFKDLKEEVMATGLISTKIYEKNIVQKARDIMDTAQCRKMKSKPYGVYYGPDPLHFEIAYDSPVTPRHIQSIILYCDFTKLCTLFSKSTRKNEWDDELKDIKKRNSKFFYFSKSLRELVNYFGSNGWDDMNGKVTGPFFSGVNVALNLSEFSIGFNTPTSTSKTSEIAWRFAGERGMMITVGNAKGGSGMQPLLNATWISSFVEEDEYLWFGSTHKLSVEGIAIVALSINYRQSVNALYLFDTALSGKGADGVSKEHIEILVFCLKYLRNEPLPPKPKEVDEFVLDNFYAFSQNKSKLVLYPRGMSGVDAVFQKLIFYGMKNDEYSIPNDNTNIFRSDLFCLFPRITEVELWTRFGYRLNLLSLLSVLAEADIPPSFRRLRIGDSGQKWIKKSFDAIPDIGEQYKAKGFVIKTETTEANGGFQAEDWIVVKPLLSN